jgi:hypothetical protein
MFRRTKVHKKEEIVQLSFWQVFKKRRKMSHGHSDKLSQKGGKYLTVILTTFHKKGGKCHMVILTNHHKRRKVSHGHFAKFSQKGGKCRKYTDYLSKRFGSLGGKTEW